MSNCIVTGAKGQLGSEIKNLVKHSALTFLFTDIDDLDLTNEEDSFKFFKNNSPDIIINCAAYTAVDKAESDWEKADLINRGVPAMLAKYGKATGCKIIHISTDYVFSGKEVKPLSEQDQTGPESKYGLSKLNGEKEILTYENSIIIRTSWLYSSYGNNFVKSMIKLMREREELNIVFDQVGTPTYAKDLAELILTIINKQDTHFKPGIYHFSNEGVASWYDFAMEIKQLTKSDCKIYPIETKDYPLPAPRPQFSLLNKEKVKNTFGVTIPYWKNSLQECIQKILSEN